MVNRALGDIPGQRVHALAIRAFAPGDATGSVPE
jgi:BolA protein